MVRKEKMKAQPSLVSIMFITGGNPFSIYFSQGKSNVSQNFVPGEVTRLSIIGSFVPSITYNFKF